LTAADFHEYHEATMNLLTTHGTSVASRASFPHFTSPIFEGPLDLLLHLIRANEVDIYDIPIAEITRQYLSYMELIEALDLEVAGEYLVIAATLIEIKSRMLLPQAPPPGDDEAEDPRAELVARLVEYQQFQGIVETMRGWELLRRRIFFRGAFCSTDDYILPIPEGEADVSQLLNALQRMLNDAGINERPVTSVVTRRRLTLRLKMAEVSRRAIAAGDGGIEFEMLFSLPCARYDIVITFLALLELLRIGRIKAEQNSPHAPIMLYAVLERTLAAL
jgi:segregation and condensation protein A